VARQKINQQNKGEEQMWQKVLSISLVLCFVSGVGLGKSNSGEWNNVRILEVGTFIVVKTKSGEKYEGHLKRATADSLSVVVKVPRVMTQVIDLRRDEVKEVRTKLNRAASAVLWSGVGLGAGVAAGAVVDSKDKYGEDPGLGKLSFGFLGLVFGTVVGTINPVGGKKVYVAP
jgi:hypothetical protein